MKDYTITFESANSTQVSDALKAAGDFIKGHCRNQIGIMSKRTPEQISETVWSVNFGAYCEVEEFVEEIPEDEEFPY